MRVVLGFELPGEIVEGAVQVGAAQAGRPLRQARPVRHPADGEAKAARVAHGGRRNDGEVAMAGRKLREGAALARLGQREAHLLDQFVGRARRHQHALEEFARGQGAAPPGVAQHHLAAQRQQHQRNLGAGVGMGHRAAHGAAVAHLEMRDEGEGLRQQRHFPRQARAPFHARLRGCRAHGQHAAFAAHEVQFVGARDVDQHAGLRQPHVEHGHQRLAAGQDPRLGPERLELLHGLVGGFRAHVVEDRRLHRATPRRASKRCHHEPEGVAPLPPACRPSCSNSCRSTILAAPSSMRPPTAATLPETSAS